MPIILLEMDQLRPRTGWIKHDQHPLVNMKMAAKWMFLRLRMLQEVTPNGWASWAFHKISRVHSLASTNQTWLAGKKERNMASLGMGNGKRMELFPWMDFPAIFDFPPANLIMANH